MSNQRLALWWHLADVAILAAALGWAILGLRGHCWLRGRLS